MPLRWRRTSVRWCGNWPPRWVGDACLFVREHHRRIATLLAALDPAPLDACRCLFGGGTAMALRHGEYRESVDVDFLVSNLNGYRQLRQLLTGATGLRPLARTGQTLAHAREVRADQYGIRSMLRVDPSQSHSKPAICYVFSSKLHNKHGG